MELVKNDFNSLMISEERKSEVKDLYKWLLENFGPNERSLIRKYVYGIADSGRKVPGVVGAAIEVTQLIEVREAMKLT